MSPIAISPASYYHCDVILIMTSRAYGARGARSPHYHYDVIYIVTSYAYRARSPRSHYDVILIVTSFATELATPTVTDVCYVRTYGHLTALNI